MTFCKFRVLFSLLYKKYDLEKKVTGTRSVKSEVYLLEQFLQCFTNLRTGSNKCSNYFLMLTKLPYELPSSIEIKTTNTNRLVECHSSIRNANCYFPTLHLILNTFTAFREVLQRTSTMVIMRTTKRSCW